MITVIRLFSTHHHTKLQNFFLVKRTFKIYYFMQAINSGEGVEKREPSCTVGGNANSIATMENSVEIP